jgi:uncharacterized membrane protein
MNNASDTKPESGAAESATGRERNPAAKVPPANGVSVDVKVTEGAQTATSAARIPAASAQGPQPQGPQQQAQPQQPQPQGPQPQQAQPQGPQPAKGKDEPRHDNPPGKPFSEMVPEHVAAMLSYLLGWVSGVIFLLVDRRPYVRYHAAQSVVVFTTLTVAFLVLGDFFLASFFHGPHTQAVLLAMRRIVELVWIITAIGLMVKASSGERYRVPYAAKHADKAAQSKAPFDETHRDMRHSAT